MYLDGALPYIICGLAVGFTVQEQFAVYHESRSNQASSCSAADVKSHADSAQLHLLASINVGVVSRTRQLAHTRSLSTQKKHCEWVGDRFMHTIKYRRCC